MINESKFHDFVVGLLKKLSDLRTAAAFLVFSILGAYTTFILITSETVFDIPNIFSSIGISTQRRNVEIFWLKFDYLYVLFSLQFVAAYFISARKRKYVNILLLIVNIFTRVLSSLHLPIYLGDIFRNELYGELTVRGYNPYSTFQNEEISFVREYASKGLPAYMWPQFTYSYPTFTGVYFLLLCLVFPEYGYWQEVFLLFVTSISTSFQVF